MQLNNKCKKKILERDEIAKEKAKAGSLKKKYPVFVPELHATFFTKKRLTDKAYIDYVEKRVKEHHESFYKIW